MDNIRTLATSEACLQAQLALGNDFTTSNFLQLKFNKCEIGKDQQMAVPTRGVDGSVSTSWRSRESKCLPIGYWWKRDLLATCAVEKDVKKAWRPFFHY